MIVAKRDEDTLIIQMDGKPSRQVEDKLESIVVSELTGVHSLYLDFKGMKEITPAMVRIFEYARLNMSEQAVMVVENANESIKKQFRIHDLCTV